MSYATLAHWFDVLAQQMPYELTQVEAAYRAVARCAGRVVCFHPTLTELTALFGMPNQGFNAGSAIRKAGMSLRFTLRKTPEIQTRLLETQLLKPCHSAQIVVIGLLAIWRCVSGERRERKPSTFV
jgi:hypothetical protein